MGLSCWIHCPSAAAGSGISWEFIWLWVTLKAFSSTPSAFCHAWIVIESQGIGTDRLQSELVSQSLGPKMNVSFEDLNLIVLYLTLSHFTRTLCLCWLAKQKLSTNSELDDGLRVGWNEVICMQNGRASKWSINLSSLTEIASVHN